MIGPEQNGAMGGEMKAAAITNIAAGASMPPGNGDYVSLWRQRRHNSQRCHRLGHAGTASIRSLRKDGDAQVEPTIGLQRPGRQPSDPPAGARIVRACLRGLLRLLFRVSIRGDATVFQNKRTLIVANHESFLDGLLLGVFLPVAATFVVHTEVTKSAWVRWLLRFVPHLVVDSTSPMAIKVICRLVESGTPVVIFPEGRLTVTGSLMKV